MRLLEFPHTPRYDWPGTSDEAELEAIRRRVPGMALAAKPMTGDLLPRRPFQRFDR